MNEPMVKLAGLYEKTSSSLPDCGIMKAAKGGEIMDTLRAAAFILNAGVLLLILVALFVGVIMPFHTADNIIFDLLLCGAPILNIVTLDREKHGHSNAVLRAVTFIVNAALIIGVADLYIAEAGVYHAPEERGSVSLLLGLFMGAPVVSTVVLILGQ